ncbi:hypothetical protein G6O67_005279 [Ophiocordyceps sinensis]|uniref:Serine hydrolase domain-containing protein n=2 Tax=Ophiocordyceps sinensis TaxID=72228 RepID=A0A8H4PR68_9HYPO|nr:duf341 domain containing protein [Ophiocordyceps sinensis CO18]KAF4508961.1 hypothetical protein G6O67_005279 [Ophiocordyceps sinensis]
MKFLCLHGSFGSAANFQTQLAPFVKEVEKSTPGRFRWIDGFHQADPPKGFTEYFGPSPLYKFVGYDGVETLNEFADKLRDFPAGADPEETIRHLTKDKDFYNADAVRKTIAQLLEVIDADPEIEGILGYSEGAMAAATVIMEERRRWVEEGIPRRIKCGVFFAGWPPVILVGDTVKPCLADECEDFIDIPTCHIVGCKDPYIHGAMALYDMCDPDSAELFDHGKGHTLPRDERTIGELTSTLNMAMCKSVAA